MSIRSLDRKSLPVILAERLMLDIADGLWADTLPGYRTIGAHYDVSDRTSKLAIQILENQGVISPSQPGLRRQILQRAQKVTENRHLLIITDSSTILDRSDEQLLHDMSMFWLKRSGVSSSVNRVSGDLGRYKKPARLLKLWIKQHAASYLLFFGPPAAWIQAVLQLGVPCYYLGGELNDEMFRGKRFPGSSQKWGQTLSLILSRLIKLGHQDLLIPFNFGRESLRHTVVKTLYTTYGGVLTQEQCEAAVPVFQDISPESWQLDWEREFKKRVPTCVVVSHPQALQSLYVFCARHGIQLGKDLSVLCTYTDELLDWYDPRPTFLEFPYDEALKNFKDWIRTGFPEREHTYLKMKWNEGSTC